MICFTKEILSSNAQIFYNDWIIKIDYINEITKKIKRLQNNCELLTKTIINDRIYEGYIIDNESVYIIELKSFIKYKNNLEFSSKHNFKLYNFNNVKIKAEKTEN
jgi:hypothetical protein